MDLKQEFEAQLSEIERELFRKSDTAYYIGYSEFLEQRLKTGQSETLVILLKDKVKKLYVEKISSSNLSKNEQELAKAVHNDAISLVISQLDGELVDQLS